MRHIVRAFAAPTAFPPHNKAQSRSKPHCAGLEVFYPPDSDGFATFLQRNHRNCDEWFFIPPIQTGLRLSKNSNSICPLLVFYSPDSDGFATFKGEGNESFFHWFFIPPIQTGLRRHGRTASALVKGFFIPPIQTGLRHESTEPS